MHTDIPGAGEEIDLQTAEKLLRSLTQKNEQGNHTWHEVVSKHVTHLESSFKGLIAAGAQQVAGSLAPPDQPEGPQQLELTERQKKAAPVPVKWS